MLNNILSALIWFLLAILVLAVVTTGLELTMSVLPLAIFVLILIGIFSLLSYLHRRRRHLHQK
jgi:membrane protein DedA with SNARE-associated domain